MKLVRSFRRAFARKSTPHIAPFQPKITNVYDEFMNEEAEEEEVEIKTEEAKVSEEKFEDSKKNFEDSETVEEKKGSLGGESSTSSSELLDPEAMKILGLKRNQREEIEQELLRREEFIRRVDPERMSQKRHNLRSLRKLDKNTRWGFIGEIARTKKQKFPRDRLPTVKELQDFLERELLKDVEILDMQNYGREDIARYAVIATGFSSRHINSAAKTLVRLLADVPLDGQNPPKVFGRKDDEWIHVNVGRDINLHLFTEQSRQDVDLPYKYANKELSSMDEEIQENLQQRVKDSQNPFKFYKV